MDAAIRELRLASERFAIERLRRRRFTSLLERSDHLLAGLEHMNLRNRRRVPQVALFHLATLIADLPFEFHSPIGTYCSPTKAIDVVFDIQEGLLQAITGRAAMAAERLEMLG
jgi:hypothetical protein